MKTTRDRAASAAPDSRHTGAPRASQSGILPRPDLSLRVRRALERWLSPITAETAVRCACRRARLDEERLGPRELGALAQELGLSLRLYLDPLEVEEACNAVRTVGSRLSSRPPPQLGNEFRVSGEHDVVEVRGAALELARRVGFDQVDAVKVATIVSELARNIVQYAGLGAVRLEELAVPRAGVEIVADDEGPGIRNVDEILSGNYRSRTGMGLGLRGSQRLADEFRIEARRQGGTRVVARKYVGP